MHALRNLHFQLQGAIDTVDDGIDTGTHYLGNANTQLGQAVTCARKRRTAMYPFWRIAKAVSAPLRRLTSLGPTTESPTNTEEESSQASMEETSFIRRVLKVQESAGVFDVPQKDALRCLGSDVRGIAEALHVKGVQWNIAVTVAIVAWLEVQFPEDRRLWVRMVEKAREYIQPHLGMELGEGEGTLLDFAEKMARDAKDTSKESDGNNEED